MIVSECIGVLKAMEAQRRQEIEVHESYDPSWYIGARGGAQLLQEANALNAGYRALERLAESTPL